MEKWVVQFHDAFEPEFDDLPDEVQDELLAHAKLLELFGPQLGRSRIDTLKGSRHANMKELRFVAADGVWRVAFAFDPKRRAVLLVAGDKSGQGERRFYAEMIRKADRRFDGRLAQLNAGREKAEREVEMATTLKDKMAALSPERRQKVEARAAELAAEELSLRDLRHAHRLTQEDVGESLGIGQEGVSRLEKRSDLLISTLRGYVEAMGGHLQLIAEFPNRPPVILSGIAMDSAPPAASGRRSARRSGRVRSPGRRRAKR